MLFEPVTPGVTTVFETLQAELGCGVFCRPDHIQHSAHIACPQVQLPEALLVVMNRDGAIEYVNPSAARLLGQTAIGRSWFDHFVPSAGRVQARTVFRRLLQGEYSAKRHHNQILTASGVKHVSWHDVPVRDEAGRIVGVAGFGLMRGQRRIRRRKIHYLAGRTVGYSSLKLG
jgi:PAS domain S-box-containing protein